MCILMTLSKKRVLINPSSLSNLILYIDANTTFAGASHNDPVSTWTDLSGNGYDQLAAGSLRPLVQKTSNTSPNGKPLVRFDGVDDIMDSGGPAPYPSIAAGYTLYFYGRFKDNGAFGTNWHDPTITRPQIGHMKAATPNDQPYVRTEADGTAVKNLHSTAIFSNLMQLFSVVFKTDGTVQAYRALSNGALTALDQNPTYTLGSVASHGGIQTGLNCLQDLATEIWFNTAHSVVTIGGIRNYLKNIYGED